MQWELPGISRGVSGGRQVNYVVVEVERMKWNPNKAPPLSLLFLNKNTVHMAYSNHCKATWLRLNIVLFNEEILDDKEELFATARSRS